MKPNDIELTEKIDKYLSNSMTPDEKSSFKKQIESNPFILNEINIHKEIKLFFIHYHLKNNLKQVATNYFKNYIIIGSFSFHKARLSFFSVMLLMMVSVITFLLLSQKELTTQELYHKYYTQYIIPNTERGYTNTTNILDNSKQNIISENYNEAFIQLNKLMESDSMNFEVQFLAGICKMENKQFSEAVKFFNSIPQSRNPYYFMANWYASLCYVASGDIQCAKEKLVKLTQTKNNFNSKAFSLLKELKKYENTTCN